MKQSRKNNIMLWLARLRGRRREKGPGQSLVEFTIMLPILLIMLSGLIEFGFALNVYLDLVDVTREVARFTADDDPLHDDSTGELIYFNEQFYLRAANFANYTLEQAGQVSLDPASKDDLIISVFTVEDDGSGTPVVKSGDRYPHGFTDQRDGSSCKGMQNGGDDGWRLYCKAASRLSLTEVNNRLSTMASNYPPDTGLVLVELEYNYHMVLGLPWITAFVPDPITLHAYTFAPNPRAEP